MINDRGKGFCTDMEISQTIEGYLAPGHSNKVFDDLFGNDRRLSDSPATDKDLMGLG